MDELEKDVSIAALESALSHMQEANKRLARLLALTLILFIGFLVYVFTGFELSTETVTIDSHQGTANYIGNDGDITNGND